MDDILTIVSRLRRAMPRNADVLAICSEVERLRLAAKAVSHSEVANKVANTANSLANKVANKRERKGYMRDYMRKRRARPR